MILGMSDIAEKMGLSAGEAYVELLHNPEVGFRMPDGQERKI